MKVKGKRKRKREIKMDMEDARRDIVIDKDIVHQPATDKIQSSLKSKFLAADFQNQNQNPN